MNTVIVENCKTLFIGRRGENEVTEVVFDFTAWQEQFGTGVIDLYVKRNLDVDAYPVVLSVDGTVATWLVTAADTDVVGNGKIEFVYTVDQKVAKSAVFPFFVGEDIGESSPEPPEHYQNWLEQLTELGAETQANAQAAAQSASEAADSAASASESAGQAEDSAEDAEAWAVGERDGEPVSAGDETYENNAKYWAENARANAPVQSVNGKDGNVELTLDDIPNGETYARATPAQLAQIGKNADDIADIDEMIPNTTSESNPLVNVSFLTNRLTSYRTSAAQGTIDAGKQEKITAYGILKRDRSGNITAAIAGADYVTVDALNSYRKATAQDAIDNAQDQNINKNTAAINTMQPAATAAEIGKALIVKTVADGKPTSYEYGDAGGGGSALTAGDGIDLTNDVISNTQGIEYIVGTQTAATSRWTGNSTDEELKAGKIIAYYLPFAGTSTAATLALTMGNGTTTREISLQLKPNATVTTQFPAGSIIILVYDGSYWRVNASYDTDTNTYPTGYCLTNGSVAAKAAACSFGYRGDTNYFPCLFRYANTAADATLAITTYAPEAAPIYVNGQRTSATNTFSAGVILFLYYNGAYYCYNDGRFPILVDGAVTSVQEYAAGLLADYRTAAAQDTIDAGKQAKITATGILKGDGDGGVSAAVAGTDYLAPSALNAYRTAADQDVIDSEQDERIDGLEQTTTATTIGPVAIATFDASAADMPLKGLTVNIEPVQSGSGDPSPDNVRPITGWTGCNILQYPENLLNVNDIRTGRITSDGGFNIDTTTRCATLVFIPVAQNANYTIATNVGVQCIAVHYYSAGNTESWLYRDAVSGQITAFTTPANCSFIRVMFAKDNTSTSITPSDITTAIIMRGNTYNIPFPSEAGTVYGGTLDVVNKKLTVDRVGVKIKNITWTYVANYERFQAASSELPFSPKAVPSQYSAPDGFMCESYSISAAIGLGDKQLAMTNNGTLMIKDTAYTTQADLKAAVGENLIVYVLASPIIYGLSDIPTILTLYGTNNIWANCGDVTVTYGAYLETVKAYADKVGDSILSAIAPLETTYTASRAYAVGSFLFVGTKFYKVTAAIASGDTITPDTNVTQTTIAEQLMALANV